MIGNVIKYEWWCVDECVFTEGLVVDAYTKNNRRVYIVMHETGEDGETVEQYFIDVNEYQLKEIIIFAEKPKGKWMSGENKN